MHRAEIVAIGVGDDGGLRVFVRRVVASFDEVCIDDAIDDDAVVGIVTSLLLELGTVYRQSTSVAGEDLRSIGRKM